MSRPIPIRDYALRPVEEDALRALRQPSGMARKAASVALWIPEWDRGQAEKTTPTFESAVREGWRRNELIFACIAKTMKARASVRLRVMNPTTEDEVPGHGFRRLMERPNPMMSEFAFHAAVVMFQKLSGHSYWEVIRSRAGVPVELWPLRPDWTSPVLTEAGLAGWAYRRGGQSTDVVRLGPRDVLDIPIPDPLSLYGGTAPVVVAGYSGDIDNAVSTFARDFFTRGALPYGILTTDQFLDADEISETQARWEQRYGGGPGRAIRAPAVLSKGQSYQSISLSFEQMGIEALDSRDETRICMALDIPPILVGASVGLERATYSNYEQARESWWQDSILPDLVHEADALLPLAREFGGDVELRWDTAEVVALQEDEAKVHEMARADLTAGGITVDEYRERLHLDKLPNGLGQVFLRPINVVETPASGRPEPAGADAAPEPPAEDQPTDALVAEETPAKAGAGPDEAKADPPHDASQRRKHERRMVEALNAFFEGELRRIEQQAGAVGSAP